MKSPGAEARIAAMATSYSGNWPLTVTHSAHGNGSYCLTLTDDGDIGWSHSGEASVDSQLTRELSDGTFQLIGRLLVATIDQPGGTGGNAGLVFISRAANGDIGKGVYEQVYDGGEFDSGEVVFGTERGC